MLNKNIPPSTIGGIKRHAKQLKKVNGVPHHEALDIAARNASFENFTHARNQLQNLNEINKINDSNFIMSFSYGRALQQSALKNWGKNIKDIINTQKIFNHRSKMNGLSTCAKWTIDLEKQINT